MNLDESLTLLALQLQLVPADLIRFAREDLIGGYHWKPEESRWPIGSMFGVEGQAIYALIRALKPSNVLEIGALRGCSTTHIATALSVNGEGRLTSVDLTAGAGDLMPNHLSEIVTSVQSDGIEYLAGLEDESLDMVLEDSSHGTDNTAAIAALCKTKLRPGAVALFHDAGHDKAYYADGSQSPSPVGAEVCAGLDRALGNAYRVYLAEPSDCGLAVYQRAKEVLPAWENGKGWVEPPTGMVTYPEKPKREMITEDGETLEIIDAPPVQKTVAKKKPGRKPKATS